MDTVYIKAVNNHIEFVEMASDTANAVKLNNIISPKYFSNIFDSAKFYTRKKTLLFNIYHLSGTYVVQTTADISNNILYKIKRTIRAEKDITQTFYYEKNQLVCADIIVKDTGTGGVPIYSSREYYKNDSVILKQISANGITNKDKSNMDLDLKKDGLFLFGKFEEQCYYERGI